MQLYPIRTSWILSISLQINHNPERPTNVNDIL
jgi:hypothetical protein